MEVDEEKEKVAMEEATTEEALTEAVEVEKEEEEEEVELFSLPMAPEEDGLHVGGDRRVRADSISSSLRRFTSKNIKQTTNNNTQKCKCTFHS